MAGLGYPTPVVAKPTAESVAAYLESQGGTSWDPETIELALVAEAASQAGTCRMPTTLYWPADLAEALCRRVARNLAMRALPLGMTAPVADVGIASTRIGSDPEIRRLEAPYRRVVLG